MSENSKKPETIYCKERGAKVAEAIRKRKALEEKLATETILKDRVKDLFGFESRIANAEKFGLTRLSRKLKVERERTEREFYGI